MRSLVVPDTPIPFDDVEVVEDTGLTLHYRIAGKVVIVGRAVPLDGTTIRHVGDVGMLVLPRWFVEQNGLRSPTP